MVVEIAFTGVRAKTKNIAPNIILSNKKDAETTKNELRPQKRWPMRCPK
jgi:hypothetical protein